MLLKANSLFTQMQTEGLSHWRGSVRKICFAWFCPSTHSHLAAPSGCGDALKQYLVASDHA